MSSLIVEAVRINEMKEHGNADKLELAMCKGWQCIVPKGKYKSGDLVIYIPIDTVFPQAFSDKLGITQYLSHQGNNVLRSKTIKLRGVISQGIIVSPDEVPGVKEGDDVAEKLGLTKWEPPVSGMPQIAGMPRRQHPDFWKFTDIENIKNYPDVLVEGEEVVISEKIHGTNFRVGMLSLMSYTWWDKVKNWFKRLRGQNYELHVGSHNVDLQDTGNNLYWKVARRYEFEKFLKPNAIVFGEIYGKGVQKLTYGLEDVEVKFFDAMQDGKYVDHEVFLAFCSFHGLPVVPGLYYGPWKKELLGLAEGKSTIADHMREGFVVKPTKERWDQRGGRVTFKAISSQYLLKDFDEGGVNH